MPRVVKVLLVLVGFVESGDHAVQLIEKVGRGVRSSEAFAKDVGTDDLDGPVGALSEVVETSLELVDGDGGLATGVECTDVRRVEFGDPIPHH